MEALRNTRIVSVFILILLFSCNSQEKENYNKLSTLLQDKDFSKFDNIIVQPSFYCAGCVEDKLLEFVKTNNTDLQAKTLFIIDTSHFEKLFYILKNANLNNYHIPYHEIDAAFPEIANLYLLKRKGQSHQFKGRVINPKDSASITYFIQELSL